MKKKLAMVLTGVAVCSLLMMGCQGKETETQTDGVQTETTDPAAEPEVEPIPEATATPEADADAGTETCLHTALQITVKLLLLLRDDIFLLNKVTDCLAPRHPPGLLRQLVPGIMP